jgi:hypothetical protein
LFYSLIIKGIYNYFKPGFYFLNTKPATSAVTGLLELIMLFSYDITRENWVFSYIKFFAEVNRGSLSLIV